MRAQVRRRWLCTFGEAEKTDIVDKTLVVFEEWPAAELRLGRQHAAVVGALTSLRWVPTGELDPTNVPRSSHAR